MNQFLRKFKLWQSILIAMVLGVIFGLIVSSSAVNKPQYAENLQFLGKIFINLIKMVVVPLVFFSLVSGVSFLKDTASIGKIGIKTFATYMATTLFAISVGMLIASIVQPGKNIDLEGLVTSNEKAIAKAESAQSSAEKYSVGAQIAAIVPPNPVRAFAESNMLQIIFFALIFGIALVKLGDKSKLVKESVNSLSDIMITVTGMVMLFAPIGVFGIMASTVATTGLDSLRDVAKIVLAVTGSIFIQMFIVYPIFIYFILKLNPLHFFKNMINVITVAFSTSSSSATLPVTIKNAKDNLGVSNETASFALPLGATVNMDGSSMYIGILAMLVCQSLGVELGVSGVVIIMVVSTLASIGVAGVPSASLVMLVLVLDALAPYGVPNWSLIAVYALVLPVDRILDMQRTALNVVGDSMVSIFVDKTEGKFDKDKFNS